MQEENRKQYLARKREEREEKRDRLRLALGLLNFFGVVAGVMGIFVLVLLIVSLLNWLVQDASSTFSVLLRLFQ